MPEEEDKFLKLKDAVIHEDSTLLRKLLDDKFPFLFITEDGQSLLHIYALNRIQPKLSSESSEYHTVHDIVYMLSDAGLELDLEDKNGCTALQYAVYNCDVCLCDALLQCSADMYIKDQSGNTLYNLVKNLDESVKNEAKLKDIFQKYHPGVWKAVENASIKDIRRLTNMWCNTNIQKNGKMLRDLALETGHEDIISLILGIQGSMKLVHHVLARNLNGVKKLLKTDGAKLQLELRNMSHHGAPLLYFILQHKDSAMVNLFIEHGCRVYTVMRDEEGYDMPVLFAALKSDMPLDVVKALFPKNKSGQEELLYRVLYKGRNVLEVALDQNVSQEVFNVLVDRGGPAVLADRNQFNETIRDVAIKMGKKQYASIVDMNVAKWILHPENYPLHRQALALYGYEHMLDIKDEDGNWIEDIPEMYTFCQTLRSYQDTIKHLAEAVQEGDLERYKELCIFSSENDFFESNVSWDGRPKGDGFPLLHRAVLYNHPHLVEAILEHKPQCQSVDTLLDQNHRTSLHYAYAIPEAIHIRKLLLDSGCSEHVLDRRGKEPLDFRDMLGMAIMNQLLERLRDKAYHTVEPDPWEDEDISQFASTDEATLDKNTNSGYFGNDHVEEFAAYPDSFDESFSQSDDDSCSEEEKTLLNRSCTVL